MWGEDFVYSREMIFFILFSLTMIELDLNSVEASYIIILG